MQVWAMIFSIAAWDTFFYGFSGPNCGKVLQDDSSGYLRATDIVVFDSEGKITGQHIEAHYSSLCEKFEEHLQLAVHPQGVPRPCTRPHLLQGLV